MVKVKSEQVELALDDLPNLRTALTRQNYYTITEAMEDLTALVNSFLVEE